MLGIFSFASEIKLFKKHRMSILAHFLVQIGKLLLKKKRDIKIR